MSFERERYDTWLRDFLELRFPELVLTFKKALDDCEQILRSDVLELERLSSIMENARSRREILSNNAAVLLGHIAARFPEAYQSINELFGEAGARSRLSALIALDAFGPTQLHHELLRAALSDRSLKLRALAADRIMQRRFLQLLPDLEISIARTPDPEIRSSLELVRDLLRDGFSARPHDGRVWVTARLPGGSLKSTFVSIEDAEKKGIKDIAESLGAEL